MTNREALERIKKSHHVAMAMLCDGKPDEETENAIKVIEQALKRLDDLENFVSFIKSKNILLPSYDENHIRPYKLRIGDFGCYFQLNKKQYNLFRKVLPND